MLQAALLARASRSDCLLGQAADPFRIERQIVVVGVKRLLRVPVVKAEAEGIKPADDSSAGSLIERTAGFGDGSRRPENNARERRQAKFGLSEPTSNHRKPRTNPQWTVGAPISLQR
jgi:hypothetical protein